MNIYIDRMKFEIIKKLILKDLKGVIKIRCILMYKVLNEYCIYIL